MAKITEKRLYPVAPQAFTADGGADGLISLANTRLFVVGQIVIIRSSAQSPITLKIKKISSKTKLYVGPTDKPIKDRTDISAFLLADGAFIIANEQERPNVPEQAVERATYDDEPIVARRVSLIDTMGNHFDDDNPLPVAATFSGEVKVGDIRITAADDDPVAGDIHSSVRINDGTNDMKVNADGSINANITLGAGGVTISEFNDISAVPSGATTTVLTYTVPVASDLLLFRVEFSGTNIATYEVLINGAVSAKKRTYFGGDLSEQIEFSTGTTGLKLVTGDVIEVNVTHNRPMVGDFEARISGQLI